MSRIAIILILGIFVLGLLAGASFRITIEGPPLPYPKGLPLTAVLHDHVAGILPPADENFDHCSEKEGKETELECQLIETAFEGNEDDALKLAAMRKAQGRTEGMIFWYTVASDNESVLAMELLGENLFWEYSSGDPIGSRMRGIFWLQRAIAKGSSKAKEELRKMKAEWKKHPSTDRGEMNIQKKLPNSNHAAKDAYVQCVDNQIPKGWHKIDFWTQIMDDRMRCPDLMDLEREALAGSAGAAEILSMFLGRYRIPWSVDDAAYWRLIAAQNGRPNDMAILGMDLWDEKVLQGRKIRGRFWLEKANRSGDKVAIEMYQSFLKEKNEKATAP